MITPDENITKARLAMYQMDSNNFDDICFTIFSCPMCGKESMDLTLLPIIDKEHFSDIDVRNTQELTLSKIFNNDFDFLLEKRNCECKFEPTLELRRVIYCYNQGNTDYHNYIDRPFEQIQKFQINLTEASSKITFLFFDTETTGLPKNWKSSYKDLDNWPRLVQIAWIFADIKGNIIEKNNFIIKPDGFSIPEDSTRVHNISTRKAFEKGYNLQFVLNQFNNCINNTNYLICHNLVFDINVVASEMHRFGINTSIFNKKNICTMESTINYCKLPGNYGYKYPKLSELYQKLFNSNFNEAHDASIDINATFKCFYELIKIKIINIE